MKTILTIFLSLILIDAYSQFAGTTVMTATFDGQELNEDSVPSMFPDKNQTLLNWNYSYQDYDSFLKRAENNLVDLICQVNSRPEEFWFMTVSDQKCKGGNGCFRGYTVVAKTVYTAEYDYQSNIDFDLNITRQLKVNTNPGLYLTKKKQLLTNSYSSEETYSYYIGATNKWISNVEFKDADGTVYYSKMEGHMLPSSSVGTPAPDCEDMQEQWEEDIKDYGEAQLYNYKEGSTMGAYAGSVLAGKLVANFPMPKIAKKALGAVVAVKIASLSYEEAAVKSLIENYVGPATLDLYTSLCMDGVIDVDFKPYAYKDGEVPEGGEFSYPCCTSWSTGSDSVIYTSGGVELTHTLPHCNAIGTCWVKIF